MFSSDHWSKARLRKIRLNVDKNKVIAVKRKYVTPKMQMELNNETMELVSFFKYLASFVGGNAN